MSSASWPDAGSPSRLSPTGRLTPGRSGFPFPTPPPPTSPPWPGRPARPPHPIRPGPRASPTSRSLRPRRSPAGPSSTASGRPRRNARTSPSSTPACRSRRSGSPPRAEREMAGKSSPPTPSAWRRGSGGRSTAILAKAGLEQGWAVIERTEGGVFGAYGVVNDGGTNDGSFLEAMPDTATATSVTIPALVETPAFRTELLLVNRGTIAGHAHARLPRVALPGSRRGGNRDDDARGPRAANRPGGALVPPDARRRGRTRRCGFVRRPAPRERSARDDRASRRRPGLLPLARRRRLRSLPPRRPGRRRGDGRRRHHEPPGRGGPPLERRIRTCGRPPVRPGHARAPALRRRGGREPGGLPDDGPARRGRLGPAPRPSPAARGQERLGASPEDGRERALDRLRSPERRRGSRAADGGRRVRPGAAPRSTPAARVAPADLEYLGAFRLPGGGAAAPHLRVRRERDDLPAGGRPGRRARTASPAPSSSPGHDRMPYGELPDGSRVAEVGIPAPVVSRDVEALPEAHLLQPLTDVTGGLFAGIDEIPRLGMQYLDRPETGPRIHLAWGEHLPPPPDRPTHAWFEPDLSAPRPRGAWFLDGLSPYAANGYMLEIPEAWASAHAAGRVLGTGRYRDGGLAGMGPGALRLPPLARRGRDASGRRRDPSRRRRSSTTSPRSRPRRSRAASPAPSTPTPGRARRG